MKRIAKWTALLLALALLTTACGGEQPADEDNGPTINYNDYVKPVTDRKIGDLITLDEVSAALGYSVAQTGSYTDSTVSYQSEDGLHMITLTLENMTRGDFDNITSDPAVVWMLQEGLGEVAYWDTPHTELIAYQNGYAVSMSVYNIADAAMLQIMETILTRLNG